MVFMVGDSKEQSAQTTAFYEQEHGTGRRGQAGNPRDAGEGRSCESLSLLRSRPTRDFEQFHLPKSRSPAPTC